MTTFVQIRAAHVAKGCVAGVYQRLNDGSETRVAGVTVDGAYEGHVYDGVELVVREEPAEQA